MLVPLQPVVLALLWLAVEIASANLRPCQSNADCSNRFEYCVPHSNFSSSGNCDTASYCVYIPPGSCNCARGYTCHLRDCPRSPFECTVIENRDTRCGGRFGPSCGCDDICGYEATGLVCIRCPCYGTHVAKCIKRDPRIPCSPRSLVLIQGNSYTCDPCASATTVLTGSSTRG